MRKLLGFLAIIFCSVFVLSGVIYANDLPKNTGGLRGEILDKRQEVKAQIREDNQEIRTQIKERFASKSAAQRERIIENIKMKFTNVIDRFKRVIERLDKISDKIQNRINKLKEKGVDTSSAQIALDSCSGEKSTVLSAIDSAKGNVAAIDANLSTVRDAVHTAEMAARDAKEAIWDYHKCLVDVTRSLRASLPKEGTESAN